MSAIATELSIGQLVPWAKTFLDYTDAVLGDLPEDDAALDWRPTDDAGTWYFSIREQAMHIVDERIEVLGWISGEETKDLLFIREYGGTGKPWQFDNADRGRILKALAAGREQIDALLARPGSGLLESSDGLRARFAKAVQQRRDSGKEEEAQELEARGPSTIINILLFLVSHEQSHRSVLQMMLRQRGHSVTRYA